MQRVWVTSGQLLQEAGYDASTGQLTVTVIKPGVSKNNRYYSPELLKKSAGIFEGCKMFADHQTDKESQARPEGSVNNWVATMGKPWVESDGTVKAKAAVIDPPFKAKLDLLAKNNQLGNMGVSIRAIGEATDGEVGGKKVKMIESLISARSVDFVTFAGAGGQVDMLEAACNDFDLDVVTEAQLKERRPDLITILERDFSDKERTKLAGTGAAMSDGSYPITSEQDLKNAIQAIGRAKNPAAVKAHIKSRAKSLGRSDLIPDNWRESMSTENKEGVGYCPPMTAAEHDGKADGHQAKADELKAGDKKDAHQAAADAHSKAADAIMSAHKASALANLHESNRDAEGDNMINTQLAKELKEALAENALLKATTKKAEAKSTRTVKLTASKLPAAAVTRLEQHFSESIDNKGLDEAIVAEQEYIKTLGAPIQRNAGASDNGSPNLQESETKIADLKKRQYEAAKSSGASEAEAIAESGYKPAK